MCWCISIGVQMCLHMPREPPDVLTNLYGSTDVLHSLRHSGVFSTISLQPQVFIKYPYISLCVSPQDQICLCNSKGLSMCLQIQNPRRVYRSLQNCRCIYIAIKKLTFYCTSAELQREKVLLTVNMTTPDPLSLLLDFYALLGHLFFCLHTLSMGFH